MNCPVHGGGHLIEKGKSRVRAHAVVHFCRCGAQRVDVDETGGPTREGEWREAAWPTVHYVLFAGGPSVPIKRDLLGGYQVRFWSERLVENVIVGGDTLDAVMARVRTYRTDAELIEGR